MKDFIDIIAESLGEDPEKYKIMRLVEQLYFKNVRRWWRRWVYPLRRSEAFKISEDILIIEEKIKAYGNINDINYVSQVIKNEFENNEELKRLSLKKKLSKTGNPSDIDQLNIQLLNDYKPYVTAIMITEIIKDEKKKAFYRQMISYLLLILVAIIANKNFDLAKFIQNATNWIENGKN